MNAIVASKPGKPGPPTAFSSADLVSLAKELWRQKFELSELATAAMHELFACYLDVQVEHLQDRKYKRTEVAAHWAYEELTKRFTPDKLEEAKPELKNTYELFKALLRVAFQTLKGEPSAFEKAARQEVERAKARIPERQAGTEYRLIQLYFQVYSEMDDLEIFSRCGKRFTRMQRALHIAEGLVKADESLSRLNPRMVEGTFKLARNLLGQVRNQNRSK